MSIVIAGDVPMLSTLLKMALEDSGYQDIDIAQNQDELLMKCANLEPSMVIIDLHIPKTQIVRLIEQILDLNMHITIIVVSEPGSDYGTKLLSVGARAYLEKPFSIFDMISIIKKVNPVQ